MASPTNPPHLLLQPARRAGRRRHRGRHRTGRHRYQATIKLEAGRRRTSCARSRCTSSPSSWSAQNQENEVLAVKTPRSTRRDLELRLRLVRARRAGFEEGTSATDWRLQACRQPRPEGAQHRSGQATCPRSSRAIDRLGFQCLAARPFPSRSRAALRVSLYY